MSNPLVAQAQSQTTAVTGIGILESAQDLSNGIKDGSWVEGGLGALGTGLEVLSMVIDPLGTLAQYGVAWLIEHVRPLKEALDWLAGDPPVIQSFSDTWANVAKEVGAIAVDLKNEVDGGTAGWTGQGADTYRESGAEQAEAIAGAASLADGISTGVMIMGMVVGFVREMVRDIVAELVGKLITWALEAACTLGFATPLIAAQATAAISSAVTRISDFIRKLVKTIGNVSPRISRIIGKLDEIIQKLSGIGRKLGGADGPSPSTPSAGARNIDAPHLDGPRSPDTSPAGTAARATDAPSSPDGPGSPAGTSPTTSTPGSRPDAPTGPDAPSGPRSPLRNTDDAPDAPSGPRSPVRAADEAPDAPSSPRSPSRAADDTPRTGDADAPGRPPETSSSPRTPAHSPDVPAHSPDTPAHSPDAPAHSPDAPARSPGTPAHSQGTPAHSPDTPASRPSADPTSGSSTPHSSGHTSASSVAPPATPRAPAEPGPVPASRPADAPQTPQSPVAGPTSPNAPGAPASPAARPGGGWTGTPGARAPDAPVSRTPEVAARGDAPARPADHAPDPHRGDPDTPGQDSPETGHGDQDPLTPDEVNQRHAEPTPAGTSYHAGDPDMGDLPQRVRPDPDGRHTVDVHVTPDGRARIGDRYYTPEEFADILRRNPGYDGGPIRLLGCDSSANGFAHRLSRELDTEVMAPTKPGWSDSQGRVYSSDYEIGPDGRPRPKIPPNGEWEIHRPDGTTSRAGDDGFTPGTRDADKQDVDPADARDRGDEPADWRDRPGPDGRTPRENIADPKYIEEHYYRRTRADGVEELVVNPNRVDPRNPPPPLDLVDGKPAFKSDRPPVERAEFDGDRSRVYPPTRQADDPGTPPDSSTPDTPAETRPGAPETGGDQPDFPDHSQDWRDDDYDAIDDRIADREEKIERYRETPEDSDDWADAHNQRNDASEALGERAAEHAIRDRVHRDFSEAFPDREITLRESPDHGPGSQRYQVVDAGTGEVMGEIVPRHSTDGGKPGSGNFDQIWEVHYKPGEPPHYIVHEAKGPGGQPSSRYLPGENRVVGQGHPDYFTDVASRIPDRDLAADLELAKLDGRLDYVEVRALVDETDSPHVNLGYEYKPYLGYDYRPPFGE
ncbi:hypothetical protein GCM10017786_71440 [Amycolatopsis deserti]|uniref:DUF4237 domain-containing protein n=1 Tax=Amycolatopsis deserti TaxID=185696 RepID=A0ABQ3JEM8_9PSEU|nr:hypothetical protein [Amycolatopsis deserti]GHF26953.1 hypothetical protein GCM10017786_71440 [Amycolatopsis deserti]